jgi:hypothetical protein
VGALVTTVVAGPASAGGQGDRLHGDVNGDGRTDRADPETATATLRVK